MQKVFFKTFGCRSNSFDTQVMIKNLGEQFCLADSENSADVIVVNSCTVTNGADAGVQGYINKFKDKKIIFTGCGLESKGRSNFDNGNIFGAFAHSQKEQIAQLLQSKTRFFHAENAPTHIDSTLVSEMSNRVRAFIKIQEGCDFACSYCIIPSVRGAARSFDLESILRQMRLLSENGVSEVILTGTNVGSWGKDFGLKLSDLLEQILKIDGLKRVRVGSLEPSQIDEKFLEIIEHEKFEKHLHIALQHSHNAMLEKMNRKNRFENDLKLCTHLNERGFFLGTDFIVGHPGETAEIWHQAVQNFKALGLTHLHPFIYSVRENTASAQMSKDKNICKVNGNEAKRRLHEIKQIADSQNLRRRELLSKNKAHLSVLVESVKILDSENSRHELTGLDEFFNKITIFHNFDSQNAVFQNLKGQWLKITEFQAQEKGNYAHI